MLQQPQLLLAEAAAFFLTTFFAIINPPLILLFDNINSYWTTTVPLYIFMTQLNGNVPALVGVNSTVIEPPEGTVFRISNSGKTTDRAQPALLSAVRVILTGKSFFRVM